VLTNRTLGHAKWIVLGAIVLAVALLLLPGRLGVPSLVSDRLVPQEAGSGSPTSSVEAWLARDLAKDRGGQAIATFGIYTRPTGSRFYSLETSISHVDGYLSSPPE
jgi:hypothetical protein